MRHSRPRRARGRGTRSARREGAGARDDGRASSPRARRVGRPPERRGGPGARAPVDHRSVDRRQPADAERRRPGGAGVQRRDLQLPRARRRAARRRRAAAHPFGHRGAAGAVPPARAVVRQQDARHVRVRDLGRAPAPPGAGARSARQEAAVLPRRQARAVVRVRAAGAAGRRRHRARAPIRARCTPTWRSATCRPTSPPSRGCASWRPAASPCSRTASWREERYWNLRFQPRAALGRGLRRGAAPPPVRGGQDAAGLRRAAGRVSVGRHRLVRRGGDHEQGRREAGQDVFDRLRGEGLLRGDLRAPGRAPLRDRAPRGGAAPARRRAVAQAGARLRRAVRRSVGAADLPAVRDDPPPCHRRAVGRRRRRGARRLHPLRAREDDAPVPAAATAAAAAGRALHRAALPGTQGRLPRRAGRHRAHSTPAAFRWATSRATRRSSATSPPSRWRSSARPICRRWGRTRAGRCSAACCRRRPRPTRSAACWSWTRRRIWSTTSSRRSTSRRCRTRWRSAARWSTTC